MKIIQQSSTQRKAQVQNMIIISNFDILHIGFLLSMKPNNNYVEKYLMHFLQNSQTGRER